MFNKIYEFIINFIKVNYKEIIFIIIFAFICLYKFPYIIYRPGGSIDLASRVEVSNSEAINGSYSMNYVKVTRGTPLILLLSHFIKDWETVKEQEVTFEDIDYETSFKIEQLEYQNAIFSAIYNACHIDNGCVLNINKEQVHVMMVSESADTDLKPLDIIISMDGKEIKYFSDILEYIPTKKAGDIIKFKVIENGKEVEKQAIVYDNNGSKIGITGFSTVDYTTDPEIKIKTRSSEAGPSGGLMLSLAIYDYLSSEDIAKGRKIMGTGTINENGYIGPIGGIKYKMLGAKKDKADIFFSPIENCDEAKEIKKEYNIKYEVKCVSSLSEAIDFLTVNGN